MAHFGTATASAIYSTKRSVYLGLNHFNQQVLYTMALTHCSTIHFLCKESCLQISDKCMYIIVYNCEISVYIVKSGKLHSYRRRCGKKQKGKSPSSGHQTSVLNNFRNVCVENPEITLEEVTKLTSEATGVSKATIYRLCLIVKSGGKLVTPKKLC
jgi:hypothetical protein